MKKIHAIFSPPRGHWVGDGFPVRSLLSCDRMGAANISPFLLLDHAGPAEFTPSRRPRGVGAHPHRGFETVTLVYRGELEHRDSSGGGGRIGEGDVQWMTAGAGVVHEEFHSPAFTEKGGTLEMVQLWVNLPARHKNAPPAYQTLMSADIPVVRLDDDGSSLRVVAGEYGGKRGPAKTFTPINVWDAHLSSDSDVSLDAPDGHTTLVVVLEGAVLVNGSEVVRQGEIVCFQRDGRDIRLEANNDTRVLVLTGVPIDEPVVARGPFVMNTVEEINQAFADFHRGRFGALQSGGIGGFSRLQTRRTPDQSQTNSQETTSWPSSTTGSTRTTSRCSWSTIRPAFCPSSGTSVRTTSGTTCWHLPRSRSSSTSRPS